MDSQDRSAHRASDTLPLASSRESLVGAAPGFANAGIPVLLLLLGGNEPPGKHGFTDPPPGPTRIDSRQRSQWFAGHALVFSLASFAPRARRLSDA